MSGGASVYTGFWKDRQLTSLEGATLTLTTTNASYLVAFLALFLGIVAGHFWAIISYAVFQIRFTFAPRGGQHHQQQAILRNYHAPGAAIWQLILSSWSWRRRRGNVALLSALPVVVLASISMLAFAAAGILSARVTSKDSDVLVKSPSCGFWLKPGPIAVENNQELSRDKAAAYNSNTAEDYHLASTMAANCQKNSSVASDCVSYAPKAMDWTTTTKSICAFDPKVCSQNITVRFDTGPVDSTVHFGINALKQDRLTYRSVVECSPLKREGYMSDWHDMNGTRFAPGQIEGDVLQTQPDEMWLEWYYGPNLLLGLNSTIIYSDREPTVHMFGSQLFRLTGQKAQIGSASPQWQPIPELNRTDADVQLLWLRQEMGMQYAQPVNDPWFQANSPVTRAFEVSPGVFKNTTAYSPGDWPLTAVACTQQFQWCDPSTSSVDPTCTDLGGLRPVLKQAKRLFKREKQQITFARLTEVFSTAGGLADIALTITGDALLINKFGYYQLAAPRDDHWIQELSHMFGTLLQYIQIRNYRFTGGYTSALKIEPEITAPQTNETWMCNSQIVKREDYQSLSVLGLAIICSFGGLVILINLSLESIVGWYQKRYNKREYASAEWELLQAETLQRQLYKSYGVDLYEENVSMGDVLERLKGRKNGETMETLIGGRNEAAKELKSMSSTGTLGKGSEIGVHVRRVSSDMTMPMSPLSRAGSS
ncbi:hypothetical protein EK21DRAFT_100489 [Setomelanomma holmii]|uniref:Uncharacterized protein n=1 Tax=Setomelanomma holmii TaxID=210430 RepID=A0A9P4HBP2_9PLEO|nr:hypothetical protein EK21DRAFT_100489 [Setomelanomma holmii]